MISFFKLYEFLRAFICANNIRSLVNKLFGVKTFNIVFVFFFFEDLISLFQQQFLPALILLLIHHLLVAACLVNPQFLLPHLLVVLQFLLFLAFLI